MDGPLVKQKKTFFTLQCTEVICVTDKSYKNSFERSVASLSVDIESFWKEGSEVKFESIILL